MRRRDVLKTILITAGTTKTTLMGGAVMPFAAAEAQERYPTRPITLIVPFAAGGLNDATARLWVENVKGPLGGTLVVDNRGGAGGTIGAAEVARAKPDGHTLLLGSSTTQVMNPAVTKVPYDPLKDFTAVSIFAVATATIAVHPSVPAKTLTELIAYIKANPGKLSYGSAGTGSNSHLAGEMFKHLAGGLDMVHIPYKGGGAAVSDLLAGHIFVASPHMTAQVLDLHNSGKIRVLAVASLNRLQGAPELLTGAESGLPGLVATTFNGIFAPAGTAPDIVARIDAATQLAMKNDEFRDILVKGGFDPVTGIGGEAAQRYVSEEIIRLAPVIKATHFMQK